MSRSPVPAVLSIAGSDSGGGAGIQADLRTFAAHGVHGVCAVTAVTAQNTLGIQAVHTVPAAMVVAQIEAVVTEFGVGAVKIGMLGSGETVDAVAASIATLALPLVVVDPVFSSTSGTRLLEREAIDILRTQLLPHVFCVTPNRSEAEVLSGRPITSVADAREAAATIAELGPSAVVITGGHLATEDVVDVLFDGRDFVQLAGPRVAAPTTHGTGCTFSAALAAHLAHGRSLVDSARMAKAFVAQAIREAIPSGGGTPLLPPPSSRTP